MDRNFEIEIYGEGVERHAENVYRLANLGVHRLAGFLLVSLSKIL
jgi:hypothetical protein